MTETPSDTDRRQFASDNNAGICPEAFAALESANRGHAPSYGEDAWTARASNLLRELFETDCEVFFVFTGTAANALAVASMGRSYHSVLCHEVAHLETDECGATEFFSNGMKVLEVPGSGGKILPDGIERMVKKRSDIHYPKPRAVSITQATEVGTVYGLEELRRIGETAERHQLGFHMDGARFANAVASLGAAPKDVTWRAGVDVLSFGASKNGSHAGDAVVFFDHVLAREFDYRCKQAGQLGSKMRFLAAPWVGLLENGVWLKNATHANTMAKRLEAGLKAADVPILFPVQANAVFAELPPPVIDALHAEGFKFYTFIGEGGCRLMCAWDTREEDVDAFVGAVARLIQASPSGTGRPRASRRAD